MLFRYHQRYSAGAPITVPERYYRERQNSLGSIVFVFDGGSHSTQDWVNSAKAWLIIPLVTLEGFKLRINPSKNSSGSAHVHKPDQGSDIVPSSVTYLLLHPSLFD